MTLRVDPKTGKALGVPEWSPSKAEHITKDLIAREVSRIAFDDDNKPNERLAALKMLGDHIQFTQQTINVSNVDATKKAALVEMFSAMSPEEREAWLSRQVAQHPLENEISVTPIPLDEPTVTPQPQHQLPEHQGTQHQTTTPPPPPAITVRVPELFAPTKKPKRGAR